MIGNVPGLSANAHELCWKYELPEGTHTVTFKWLNPAGKASVRFTEAVVYANLPAISMH